MVRAVKNFFIFLLIGVLNTIILLVFELIVTNGTDYLWNNILNTDTIRWLLIPSAIVLSIVYSGVLKIFKQNRIDKLDFGDPEEVPDQKVSLSGLGIIFVIGSVSLLSGASLGPEASIVALASGLGLWFADKSKDWEKRQLFALASVGALLVAFLGSLLPILIPILVFLKQDKKLNISHALPSIIAGVAAYITFVAIHGPGAIASIPIEAGFSWNDIFVAVIVGILGAFGAMVLRFLINKSVNLAKIIDSKMHWIISAGIFGFVLGAIYLIGGQEVEFSGRIGTELLVQNGPTLAPIALVVIIITKILATSWSLGAGWRGGLVFPSICTSVALGFLVGYIVPGDNPGVVIGSISGMLTAVTSPVLGLILVLSMIPHNFIIVALAGFLGAGVGVRIIKWYNLSK